MAVKARNFNIVTILHAESLTLRPSQGKSQNCCSKQELIINLPLSRDIKEYIINLQPPCPTHPQKNKKRKKTWSNFSYTPKIKNKSSYSQYCANCLTDSRILRLVILEVKEW